MGNPSEVILPDIRNRLPELRRVGSGKVVGEAVEVLFKYHCMRVGLIPHTPEGDPPCHDAVVFNTQTGKFKSVQVKSTSTRNKKCNGSYKIKAKCYSDRVPLKDTYVDVLAVFVIPYSAWYLVPIRRIRSANLNFFPHIENSKGMYERYRNNWKAFGKIL